MRKLGGRSKYGRSGCSLWPAVRLIWSKKPAAERTGLLSSSARMPPSALGRLQLLPELQIQHSKFKIQNYGSGSSLRRPLATWRSCGPSPPEAAARRSCRTETTLRIAGPIQAQLKAICILLGQQPAEHASDVKELRASAAGGCGPPTSCEVDSFAKHSRN